MPTIRPTKRLFLPTDDRQSTADDPMALVILDDAEDRSGWSEALDAVTRDTGVGIQDGMA